MVIKPESILEAPYEIKLGQVGEVYQFRVYRPPSNKLVGKGEAKSREEALGDAKQQIENIRASTLEARLDGIPTATEYVEAISTLDNAGKITTNIWGMLKAHLTAPERKLSSQELAEAVGFADYEIANRQYGGLGRMIAEYLDFEPPEKNTLMALPFGLRRLSSKTRVKQETRTAIGNIR